MRAAPVSIAPWEGGCAPSRARGSAGRLGGAAGTCPPHRGVRERTRRAAVG